MTIARAAVMAQVVWFMALCPVTALKAAEAPLQVEISVDQVVAFRGAVSLSITYTNTSESTISLQSNGSSANGGFPGETFEITTKAGRKSYTVFAVDPLPLEFVMEPGKSWKRTIKDLAPVLSNSGVKVDGEFRDPKDPLPDPFGRPGEYTIRLLFESTVKNEPTIFSGTLVSNMVKLNVDLR